MSELKPGFRKQEIENETSYRSCFRGRDPCQRGAGAVLAYVEDRRKMEKPGGGRIDSMTMPTNSVTVWSDVGRWARSAASRL
ncbi:MAG: hypothetical protein O7F73_19000, partial [Gammaproteobacteria bacterium]|nr:hypothetical protein [Gammaproteobacteria bacterium]